jgi:hypothetical protein
MIHQEGTEKSNQTQRGFSRGMAYNESTGQLFVTYTPCILQIYDTKNDFKIIDRREISVDEDETPYDILLDPRDW